MKVGKKPGIRSQEKLWQQAERRFAASEKIGEAGRLDEACTGFAEASQLFRQAGDDSAAALCIHAMGALYIVQDDPAQALDLFTEALHLVEGVEEPVGEAMCCESVGTAYFRLKNYVAARQYYGRALLLYRVLDDIESAAMVLGNLGDCMLLMERFAEALEHYGGALVIYTALEDRARMVDLNASLAIAAVSLQDDRAAIEFLKTAQVIDQELGGAHAAQIKTMLQEVGTFAQPKRKSRGKASRTG